MTINHLETQPWDDDQMVTDLRQVVTSLPRVPLAELGDAEGLGGPGIYLQFLSTSRPELVDLLTSTLADSRVPLYVGSAVGSANALRARIGRYGQSLADLPSIRLDELYVSVMPCTTKASALFAEAALLDTPGMCGAMNRIGGWGQKVPGARRVTQAASPVDSLFAPGRGWTRPPSLVDQVRARCQLLAYLAELDPAGYRWPSLQGNR